jgi:outer membrane receptor protein involved in Fe transport
MTSHRLVSLALVARILVGVFSNLMWYITEVPLKKEILSLVIFTSLCVLVFFSANVVPVYGQTDTGRISGTISDATGGIVVGAKVVVKSVNTGQARETTTNSSGLYTIPSLRPDAYDVIIEATGFASLTKRVEVTVGSQIEVSIQLEVGKATTVVEVTASEGAATVNTQDQTLSELITSKDIDLLPTSPTRNPYALVGTSGNVTSDSSSMRGTGYAINGMRSASTNILLDGADNVDTFTASVGQTIPLDSVQEFSVLTSNFGAEYGRASGGVVNLVTKSGTNTFHGSAYEYNRVSALSSNTEQNDATDTPKGVFTRNDFGFALGGPIKKDKLFFFNNTEWIRVRSSAPTDYTIIDPASVASLAPASQAFFTAYGKLASGVKTIATGPCSTTVANSPTCDTVVFAVPSDAGGGNPQNTWMEVARVDYNFSANTTLFFRYAAYNELDFPGTVNSSPYVGYNTGQTTFDQNYEISYVHFFSPSLANTAKLTYNRLNGPVQGLSTAPVSPTLYTSAAVPSVTLGGNSFPLIFPGYNQTAPGLAIPFGGPQNLYQLHDDLSWSHGKHQFKFGGQYLQIRDNRVFGAYENPVEELGTNLNTGLANLVSGNIYLFEGAVYPQGKFPCPKNEQGHYQVSPACTLTLPVGEPAFNRNYRYNDGAAYAQDSWKIKPRLTLNLGLRWEYYGVQHNANPALDSNFVFGSGANEYEQIRNGSVQLAQNGGVFWKPDYHNFGPRVGFAWDIFGDGKTSLRGGYGISYERNFGNVTFNAIQNPPNYAVISLQSFVDTPVAQPVYTDVAGPLAGTGTKFLPAVSQRAINQNIKTAYAETWNLSVDRSVGQGVFSVTYAGSRGVHLYDISNINPGAGGNPNGCGGGGQYLGDTNCPNRINYQYSAMNFRSDNGFSFYNALIVKYQVTNLLHKGLGIGANYTFSHSLDNLSSTFSDGNGAGTSGLYQLGYLDAFNPRLNYGNSDFDIRHRFIFSLSWELPWMKSASNAFARTVLGGWGLGSILAIHSGQPFGLYDFSNYNGTAAPLWVPNEVVQHRGTPTVAGANLYNYIALPYMNTATGPVVDNLGVALGLPNCTGLFHTGCTYTTNGQPYPLRNQFFGPNFWNLDMNFYKTFKLTERFGLQFRGEFYNIFNHHNQYVTSENLDVSSLSTPFIQTQKGGIFGLAGQPTDERRNIQFGLKLMF